MSDTSRPIAVLGATGQQGSQVVEALLDARVPVRAIVRDPSAPRARDLEGRGVEVVTGDQENGESLLEPLRGVDALFLMTTYGGEDATEGEVRRGTTVAEAAAEAGVPPVVYSSVGSAERQRENPSGLAR